MITDNQTPVASSKDFFLAMQGALWPPSAPQGSRPRPPTHTSQEHFLHPWSTEESLSTGQATKVSTHRGHLRHTLSELAKTSHTASLRDSSPVPGIGGDAHSWNRSAPALHPRTAALSGPLLFLVNSVSSDVNVIHPTSLLFGLDIFAQASTLSLYVYFF